MKKLTPEELKQVKEHMHKALFMSAGERDSFIAQTIGDVFDVELPIASVIEAIADVRRTGVAPDNHVYFNVPASITKKVRTLTSGCTVVDQNITPNERQELQFTHLVSPRYNVCINEWVDGDHDVLDFYARSINEAMNRQEIYAVLNLIEDAISGTGGTANTFGPESGEDDLTFPVLARMRKSIKKYGSRFVLITGANVDLDLTLMDYNADTTRPYGLSQLGITAIAVEDLQVEINGAAVDVIDPDVAYLIAVSDASGNKPILFARRKLTPLYGNPNVTREAKERIIIDNGPVINVGTDTKLAVSKMGYESYGAVLLNDAVIAKFEK